MHRMHFFYFLNTLKTCTCVIKFINRTRRSNHCHSKKKKNGSVRSSGFEKTLVLIKPCTVIDNFTIYSFRAYLSIIKQIFTMILTNSIVGIRTLNVWKIKLWRFDFNFSYAFHAVVLTKYRTVQFNN